MWLQITFQHCPESQEGKPMPNLQIFLHIIYYLKFHWGSFNESAICHNQLEVLFLPSVWWSFECLIDCSIGSVGLSCCLWGGKYSKTVTTTMATTATDETTTTVAAGTVASALAATWNANEAFYVRANLSRQQLLFICSLTRMS